MVLEVNEENALAPIDGLEHDFERLFAEEGPRVWRTIYAFTAGRRDIAEEAVAVESREHGPSSAWAASPTHTRRSAAASRSRTGTGTWSRVRSRRRGPGTFHVVGTYDGSTFTVSEAGPYEQSHSESTDFTAPCPEPAGGWIASDPDRATDADLRNVMHAAEREPDSAGFWIDDVGEPPEFTPAPELIAVAAFTGDLERHESEHREVWGGPLCVTRHERT
ncbi:MAG: hypothetical protein ACRDGW_01305, partial [Actinomycetota bacterium]